MRSLIAPKFTDPSGYAHLDRPNLTLTKPTELLIKVHAASINGHDIIMASGRTKMLQTLPLPYPLGLDFAGVVAAAGSDVTSYKVGDAVYGFAASGGTASTLLVLDTAKPHAIAKIPSSMTPGLSFSEAASLPAVAITAQLALQRADEFLVDKGGLTGKTVFIPGALSGVGSVALQIAKKEYKCLTFSAASTSKIQMLPKYLGEGVVDKCVDYTQTEVVKEFGKGSVDFVFDTTGLAAEYLPLLKRGGLCLSIARLPPGSTLKDQSPDAPQQSRVACIGQNVMDGLDAAFRTWAKTRFGVVYVYQKTEPVNQDMERLNDLLVKKSVRAVVGKSVALDDIDEIRDACLAMYKGKGGVGKFVITMEGQDE